MLFLSCVIMLLGIRVHYLLLVSLLSFVTQENKYSDQLLCAKIVPLPADFAQPYANVLRKSQGCKTPDEFCTQAFMKISLPSPLPIFKTGVMP
ncbi:MAG TPA: hypothetical protein DCP31_04830 [Cyanobacteria bacterium UBA8543]|nr:hypothetical protein [Cyanobacteria bacterium UBA8543]